MSDQILRTLFENGQELTHHELRQAHKAITGRDLPRGAKPQEVARYFVATCPLKFEFEVNKVRGFAFEAGEL